MTVLVCALTPAAASSAAMGMNREVCFISRDFAVTASDVRRGWIPIGREYEKQKAKVKGVTRVQVKSSKRMYETQGELGEKEVWDLCSKE